MSWIYNGNKIQSIEDVPEGAIGFIYNIVTYNVGGKGEAKEYIGSKVLFHDNKRLIKSKEYEKHPDKRTLRKYKSKRGKNKGEWMYYEDRKKESDWMTYTGSNDKLNSDIAEGVGITKYILKFVFKESHLLYEETKAIFCTGALEEERFYNDHALSRFFKKNIIQKTVDNLV